MSLEHLAAPERAVFEWQDGMCGGFQQRLMDTIASADGSNLARLALGFPNEVEGFLQFRETYGWWPMVQRKAGWK